MYPEVLSLHLSGGKLCFSPKKTAMNSESKVLGCFFEGFFFFWLPESILIP